MKKNVLLFNYLLGLFFNYTFIKLIQIHILKKLIPPFDVIFMFIDAWYMMKLETFNFFLVYFIVHPPIICDFHPYNKIQMTCVNNLSKLVSFEKLNISRWILDWFEYSINGNYLCCSDYSSYEGYKFKILRYYN